MSKRELDHSGIAVDAQHSPAKRHKDDAGEVLDVTLSDPPTAAAAAVDVKEQGLQLWNVIKNAVNKECVLVTRCVADALQSLTPTFSPSTKTRSFVHSEAVSTPSVLYANLRNDSIQTITGSSNGQLLWKI